MWAYCAMLDALEIRGPFCGPTGYDRHVRGFARALHDLGVAVRLVDLPQWSPARLPPGLRDPFFVSLTRPVHARTVLHCCMPPQVRKSPDRIDVNYTMFEATPIPPLWAAVSNRPERIVVPTESSARAWRAAGVAPERLAISPLGVDAKLFGAVTPGRPSPEFLGRGDIWSRRCRFLNVAEVGPRKNLLGLLRAWLRATTREDDAALILKPGFYAPGARERFAATFAAAAEETGITTADAAPIAVIDRLFADAAMPQVFAAATHYFSLSCGEGWDQPMMEAGASGLRLIAPAHSAYLAYLDPSCATLIPSVPVLAGPLAGPELAPLFGKAGITWWQPDEDAAVRAVRAAIDGRDAAVISPRERILRDFNWDQAARRLLTVLAEVERSGARRWSWRALRRGGRN
jgi:glycosyltransferase involved in cell wall biosynthesis